MDDVEAQRILVVEDDAVLREAVMCVLGPRGGGWSVAGVGTLAEALESLRLQSFNVVVLDLGLPDAQGLEALRRLRQAHPQIATVVMTGESDEAVALQALALGAQEYLVKGAWEWRDLQRTIRYALERTQAEERLRFSQELFASTLDALSTCIAILDELGVVLGANAAWRAFQDPRNPLIWNCPVGANYLAVCESAVREGESVSFVAAGILDILTGRSSSFLAEYQVPGGEDVGWFELNITRLDRGGQIRVVVAHRDITGQKLTDQRLRQSEELFRTITEHAEDLIAIVDPAGRRRYHSPSYHRMLGYTEEELEALGPMDAVREEDRPKISQALEDMLRTGTGHRLEYRMRRKDDTWVDLESYGVPIHDPAGALAQILIVARDITFRKEAERERAQMEVQLRQAQKLESIGQLAAGIAHEINTPIQYIGDNGVFLRDAFQELLGAMSMQEQLFQEIKAGTLTTNFLNEVEDCFRHANLDYLKEEITQAIVQSMEGVQRVSKIVSAMKEFSHPGGEEKVQVDLNRAIESTLTVSRNEWKYVAEMETHLDPELPPVFCHPGEFNQVVLNLVVNAAHAIADVVGGSGDKGRITVSTRRDGDWAEVRVADTGSGIPEAVRSRIFDPFFTTKPVGKGTGQGLAIAHSAIVDKHRGTLAFETEVGRGTAFVVRLPLLPSAPGEHP